MTSRRDTVRALAGLAALPIMGRLGLYDLGDIGRRAHALAESAASDGAPLRALTESEFQTVSAAAERIIPRTTTPGATDANVAGFVDVMLADWYKPEERDLFKAGLGELDTRANRQFGRSFSAMNPTDQTQLLEALDAEVQAQRQSNSASANANWFAMLKFLTIWGFYTSRVGIREELQQDLTPGYYDGNAAY